MLKLPPTLFYPYKLTQRTSTKWETLFFIMEGGEDCSTSRMGEEDSSLFDQFERLSFEIQLNQAILGRSYSEPTMLRFIAPPPPQPVFHRRNRSSSSRRFSTALKKLLKPIFGRKAQEVRKSQMPMGSRRVGRLADLFALELLGDL